MILRRCHGHANDLTKSSSLCSSSCEEKPWPKRPGPQAKVIGAAATNRCQAAPVRVTELFNEFLGFSYQSAQLGSPLEGLPGVGPVLQSVLIVFGCSRSLAAMHTTSRFSGQCR